jgi:hypothetical protein
MDDNARALQAAQRNVWKATAEYVAGRVLLLVGAIGLVIVFIVASDGTAAMGLKMAFAISTIAGVMLTIGSKNTLQKYIYRRNQLIQGYARADRKSVND